jgi:superfamily II DNA helicase RecQ
LGIFSIAVYLTFPSRFFFSFSFCARLSPEVKAVRAASLDALRRYAANGTACRRAALLAHFGETAPAWGVRCGTCDACERAAAGGGGLRDYTALSLLLLEAAAAQGRGAAKGKVLACAHGGCETPALVLRRSHVPSRNGRGPSLDLLKELLPQLVAAGYLARATAAFEQRDGGRTISYETVAVAPAGQRLLSAHRPSSAAHGSEGSGGSGGSGGGAGAELPRVLLAAPQGVLAAEAAAKGQAAARAAELVAAGVDTAAIPLLELAEGSGPTLEVYQSWVRKLAFWQQPGRRAGKAAELEALREVVLQWRDETAAKLGMAPVPKAENVILCKINK